MTQNQKIAVFGVGGVLLLLFLFRRPVAEAVAAADPFQGFYAPYESTNPGIPDNYDVVTGGDPLQSVINVNVNAPGLGQLNNHYIPVFGLVGMTGVRG